MDRRRPLLLNLDAELELARPRSYRPSAAVTERVRVEAAHLAAILPATLLPLIPGAEPPRLEGLGEASAWCPTPSALASLAALGFEPPAAPSMAILRRANSRSFLSRIETQGEPLPESTWASSPSAVHAHLRAHPHVAQWLAKREFGGAGRGRRRLRQALAATDLRWIEGAFVRGQGDDLRRQLRIEPQVEVALEWTRHGLLRPSGELRLGEPCVQVSDPRGAWSHTRLARPGELEPDELAALDAALRAAAAALVDLGYFGPLGVDGFRWIDTDGCRRVRAVGELHARYTTGWWLGTASWRDQ
ncbi:hypothetical protein [Engelhardtia mirabilis]|uniref:ATP-grasp domain-containing protein n=1 Tax=Engelhardtia mirabilis TaxID=2528011 RepID=A0A518BLD0_9BACT|nr:hypothetical protein Pla133_28700 [Planctomycetes bacterium Pla133]QDV02107.1 hypothetical protein Pla86_28690 [Planctomycetes bacterium Pla86]